MFIHAYYFAGFLVGFLVSFWILGGYFHKTYSRYKEEVKAEYDLTKRSIAEMSYSQGAKNMYNAVVDHLNSQGGNIKKTTMKDVVSKPVCPECESRNYKISDHGSCICEECQYEESLYE